MLAQRGFDAVEIDPRTAYLHLPVVAPESLEQPVRPLSDDIAGSKDPKRRPVKNRRAFAYATSIDPMSQGDVRARDQELTNFTARRITAMLIEDREVVAGQRV